MMFYKLSVLSLSLLLSSCAIPDLGPMATPREDLIKYKGEGKTEFVYPKHDWWKLYKDPQLNQLIEEGLSQSPSITEAVARVQKANAQLEVAGGALLPSLSADFSLSKYRQSYHYGVPKAFVPKGFNTTSKAALNFNYELDFFGKNSDAIEAATSEMLACKLMLDQANIILSCAIASTYASLDQFYEELDVLKENVSVREKTLELFAKRLGKGLENESSVEQAKSNLAAAEAELAAMEETINLTLNSIAALVGTTPDRAIKIARPKLEALSHIGIPEIIPVDLISRRPDVIASQLTLEAAASMIGVAKAGYYPNVNLTAFIGRQSFGLNYLGKSGTLTGMYGPAIHLPIFQGGFLDAQYRGARADYDSSLASYESAIIQALREVADAITSHKALDKRVKKITTALRAAEKAYKLSKNRYEGGLSTYLEVLRAEDNLIVSRRAMAQIKARAFTLDVALAKALGGGFKPVLESRLESQEKRS